jgi:hypothetical protein
VGLLMHNRHPLDPDRRRLHVGMRNAILLSLPLWTCIGVAIAWAWRQ